MVKELDADGDQIYGTDGFVLVASPSGEIRSDAAYAVVRRVTPGVLTSGDRSDSAFADVDLPDGGSTATGLWYATGSRDREEQELADIVVTADASFRVGIMVDGADVLDASPEYLHLRQLDGGRADAEPAYAYRRPDANVDWYFFDVRGARSGDRYRLSGTNRRDGSPRQDLNGVVAITFDTVAAESVELEIRAGLRISGAVGAIYRIEVAGELTESYRSNTWRAVEFLQLPVSPYWWSDRTEAGTRGFYRAVPMAAPENMVFIPPGTFRMGSPVTEEERWESENPQTTVVLSRGFWMGKFEVTQAEYAAVTGSNPSAFPDDPSCPVEMVNWGDADDYCRRLTERERGAGRIPARAVFRLPTEAEWEYACRAWTSTRFPFGDDSGYQLLSRYGWFQDNAGGRTHPVGRKLPNPWGLYDMSGNVWEWCLDRWAGFLPGGIVVDPKGASIGERRVIRGGAWRYDGNPCRSADRDDSWPTRRCDYGGFRVVLAVED